MAAIPVALLPSNDDEVGAVLLLLCPIIAISPSDTNDRGRLRVKGDSLVMEVGAARVAIQVENAALLIEVASLAGRSIAAMEYMCGGVGRCWLLEI